MTLYSDPDSSTNHPLKKNDQQNSQLKIKPTKHVSNPLKSSNLPSVSNSSPKSQASGLDSFCESINIDTPESHQNTQNKSLVDSTLSGTKNILSELLRGIWGPSSDFLEPSVKESYHSINDSNQSSPDTQIITEHGLIDTNYNNPEKNIPVSPPKLSTYQKINHYIGHFSETSKPVSNPKTLIDPISSIVASRTGQPYSIDNKDKKRLAKRTGPAPSSPLCQIPLSSTRVSNHNNPYTDTNENISLHLKTAKISPIITSPNNESKFFPPDNHRPLSPEHLLNLTNQYAPQLDHLNINPPSIPHSQYLKPKSKGKVNHVLTKLFLAQEIQSNSFGVMDQSIILLKSPPNVSKNLFSNQFIQHNNHNPKINHIPINPHTSSIIDSAKKALHSISLSRKLRYHNKSLISTTSSNKTSTTSSNKTSNITNIPYNRYPQFNYPPSNPEHTEHIDNFSFVAENNADRKSTIYSSSILNAVEPSAVWNLSFSICGRYIAAGGQGGILRIWRLNSFSLLENNPEHLSANQSLPYELLESQPYRVYSGHKRDILCISWSRSGLILTASMDRTVKLWHPKRKKCVKTFYHNDAVTSVSFHPTDDRLFISGGLDGRLRLWDISSNKTKLFTDLPDNQLITAVSFSNCIGDQVVVGTYLGLCVFYEMPNLKISDRLYARNSSGKRANGIKITGITYCSRKLSLANSSLINDSTALSVEISRANRQRIYSSEDQEEGLVLVSSNDSRIRIYTEKSHKLVCKLKGHVSSGSQAFATASEDGKYVISGSEDHNIYIWSLLKSDIYQPNISTDKKFGINFAINSKNIFNRKNASNDEIPSDSQTIMDNSNYEYFNAHDYNVSAAVFAPLTTLMYLANSGDPILSKQLEKLKKIKETNSISDLANVIDVTSIIVSADFSGMIRIFRKNINLEESNSNSLLGNSHANLGKNDLSSSYKSNDVPIRKKFEELNQIIHKRAEAFKPAISSKIKSIFYNASSKNKPYKQFDENNNLKQNYTKSDSIQLSDGPNRHTVPTSNDAYINPLNSSSDTSSFEESFATIQLNSEKRAIPSMPKIPCKFVPNSINDINNENSAKMSLIKNDLNSPADDIKKSYNSGSSHTELYSMPHRMSLFKKDELKQQDRSINNQVFKDSFDKEAIHEENCDDSNVNETNGSDYNLEKSESKHPVQKVTMDPCSKCQSRTFYKYPMAITPKPSERTIKEIPNKRYSMILNPENNINWILVCQNCFQIYNSNQ
ncbi:putative WD repeat-containing protein [Smittium culicis]|uniref:Putative WD repeat-containing protein n=1 Tax=Smittium culicis TaxID=133412 RepID=A0A1R1X447_9FUNG|nr:putative WD repeat-containing protein [Smittium culicis]